MRRIALAGLLAMTVALTAGAAAPGPRMPIKSFEQLQQPSAAPL